MEGLFGFATYQRQSRPRGGVGQVARCGAAGRDRAACALHRRHLATWPTTWPPGHLLADHPPRNRRGALNAPSPRGMIR